MPMDDDPLTSPSFPAINTSDSRSYRTRRPGGAHSGAHSGPHTSPPPAGGRDSGSFAAPAQQFSPYPERAASGPGMTPPTPAPVPQSPAPQSPAPLANPYGSYVSAPQPTYQDVAPSHLDPYGASYPIGQHAGNGWYSGMNGGPADPAPGQAATGYLPPAGYNGNGNGAGQDNGGRGQDNGYPAADYQGYQGAAYYGGQAGPGGYGPQGPLAGQYDQRGYGTSDLTYGQDGYPGYPGYGTSGR
jgi:hypothetical protein